MSQETRILARLHKGPLTQIDALTELGVMRLASRVSDMKAKMVPIKKRMVTVHNRYGEKCRIAEYSL